MIAPRVDCSFVRARASLCLDGRLDVRQRRAVGEHLEGCAGCRTVYSDLHRLSAATAALRRPAASPVLRRRVRASLLGPARRRRARGQQVAAVAAGVLVLAGALVLGSMQAGGGADAGSAPPDPAARASDAAEPLALVRSGRALLEDLLVLDRIPPGLRRPLITAQLAAFDLPAQADRWLARSPAEASPLSDLAAFIRSLEARVGLGAEGLPSREDVERARTIRDRLPPAAGGEAREPPPLEHLSRVVQAVGAHLDRPGREALLGLLALRDEHRRGSARLAVAYARRLADLSAAGSAPAVRDPLAPAVERTLRTTLADAGLEALVELLPHVWTGKAGRGVRVVVRIDGRCVAVQVAETASADRR